MAKSKGQELIERIEAFLSSYVVFPEPAMALVAAFWIVNTYVFQVFDAVAYLAVTAETKRAGKTTFLDLISFLCFNPEKAGAGTDATLWRLMEAHGGWATLLFDESEKMSSGTVGMKRQFMNFGYRTGESIPRTMPNGTVVKFPCYGPKVFALIGDLTDTLRDRAILFVMRRAVSPKPYRPTTANREAGPIAESIAAYVKSGALKTLTPVAPEWLTNRDQEIWESLYSLALCMQVDHAMLTRLQAASVDMTNRKSAPIRRHVDLADAEAAQQIEDYGLLALRDLASVMPTASKTATGDLFSSVAVERMKALPLAPWRMFRGEPISENTLATLLARFVQPVPVRMERGRGKLLLRGYRGVKVSEAIARLEGVL